MYRQLKCHLNLSFLSSASAAPKCPGSSLSSKHRHIHRVGEGVSRWSQKQNHSRKENSWKGGETWSFVLFVAVTGLGLGEFSSYRSRTYTCTHPSSSVKMPSASQPAFPLRTRLFELKRRTACDWELAGGWPRWTSGKRANTLRTSTYNKHAAEMLVSKWDRARQR